MTRRPHCVFDIEIAPNLAMIGLKFLEAGEPEFITLVNGHATEEQVARLAQIALSYTLVGYNAARYDQIIYAALCQKFVSVLRSHIDC